MSKFYLLNNKYICNKEKIVLHANSIIHINTDLVLSFKKNERIVLFGCIEEDDNINTICQLLREEKDKDTKIILSIINSNEKNMIIQPDTKIVKLKSFLDYHQQYNTELQDYRQIFDNFDIKVFVKKEDALQSIETVVNEDNSPKILSINFKDK